MDKKVFIPLPDPNDQEYEKQRQEFIQRQEIRQKNLGITREQSKKRLMENLGKKFKTTMIGALDRFEKKFGHLWGHKKTTPLTEQELQFRQMYDEVRTEILDNGNNQLRIAYEEIAQYTVAWEKYNLTFITKDNKEN